MDDVKSKLEALEALYGSQKAAAEKLGVSVPQYRKYKTGKAVIPQAKQAKANRLFGANKKKVQTEDFQKKLSKRKTTSEKKRSEYRKPGQAKPKIKKPKKYPGGILSESLMNWMRRKNFPQHIQEKLPGQVAPFVAYPAGGGDDIVQFVDADEIAALRFGKQEATRSLILIGLVIQLLTTNGKTGKDNDVIRRDPEEIEEIKEEGDLEDMDVFITRGRITTKTRKAWSLEETRRYAERLFMGSQSFGRNLEPGLFLGFQL